MPTTTEIEATLNINAIGARTDFAGAAIADLSAEEIRYDQAQYSEGILKPVEAYETNAGGGGTMDVIIGSGTAKTDYMLVDGDISGQGSYLVRLDDVTKTITLSAPDPSQNRTDEIWLVVLDNAYDSSAKATPILAVREGDVGGGAPGPDAAWEAAVKLATILVPGGSSDITEATITDDRVYTDLAFANGGSMPVGGGFLWFASSAPTGHILARGQLEDPAQYPRLFQLWGTDYGGDGSSTFGVPDLRQRLPLGRADSGTGSVLGDTGGQIDHFHTQPTHLHTQPSHTHSNPSTGSAGSHTHSVNPPASSTNTDGAHEHRSYGPDQVTPGSSTGEGFIVGTSASAHSHSFNIGSFTSGSGGSHTHSQGDTGSSGNDNTGSAGDENTGSANPPFLVVEYAIRAA